uniref:hypothetical protein n=1 Tax=Candidatus Electronema sp. TaxID=2698783 RepID=UPI004057307A
MELKKWVLAFSAALAMLPAGMLSAQEQVESPGNYQGEVNGEIARSAGKAVSLKEQGATAATDGSSVSYARVWLSSEHGSLVAKTSFWAGDRVCGNHINRVLYGGATYSSIYGVHGAIFASDKLFNNTESGPGDYRYSWCLDLPLDKAERGPAAFNLRSYRNEQNSALSVNLPFNVLRYGYVNSNRRYMPPISAATSTLIYNSTLSVWRYLTSSTLKYSTILRAYSANALSFLNDLKIYRPSAALIHSHGSSTGGGRIYLKDESYVYANSSTGKPAPSSGTPPAVSVPGGLFYAAVCEGATAPTLGNAFLAAGYNAYIGYTVSVYTDRNAQFYTRFFAEAEKPNVTVSTALANTVAWATGQGWSDVATATIIGDGSSLYLGGRYTPVLVPRSEAVKSVESSTEVVRHWTDISTIQLTEDERKAVATAMAIKDMRDTVSNAKNNTDGGSDAVTGIEQFGNIYRVTVKVGGKFVRGVDIDTASGAIVAEGAMD